MALLSIEAVDGRLFLSRSGAGIAFLYGVWWLFHEGAGANYIHAKGIPHSHLLAAGNRCDRISIGGTKKATTHAILPQD